MVCCFFVKKFQFIKLGLIQAYYLIYIAIGMMILIGIISYAGCTVGKKKVNLYLFLLFFILEIYVMSFACAKIESSLFIIVLIFFWGIFLAALFYLNFENTEYNTCTAFCCILTTLLILAFIFMTFYKNLNEGILGFCILCLGYGLYVACDIRIMI